MVTFIKVALICLVLLVGACNYKETYVGAYKWNYAENCIEVRYDSDIGITAGVYCKVEVERK